MDYTEKLNENIKIELVKAGFSVGGENGADKVVIKFFVAELAKMNASLDELYK